MTHLGTRRTFGAEDGVSTKPTGAGRRPPVLVPSLFDCAGAKSSIVEPRTPHEQDRAGPRMHRRWLLAALLGGLAAITTSCAVAPDDRSRRTDDLDWWGRDRYRRDDDFWYRRGWGRYDDDGWYRGRRERRPPDERRRHRPDDDDRSHDRPDRPAHPPERPKTPPRPPKPLEYPQCGFRPENPYDCER